ncbi:MAG: YfhO family protein, partial [Anaerolineae bacterium]|nr:YfhO family protein [Anaerolineae bacterium]
MTDRLLSRALLVLVILTLGVVFHRLLLGEVFFWGLPSLQFYPWREFAFDMLRSGQLPLWNPYNGAGAPLIANYQSALFYPLSWLGLLLPLAWAMSVTVVLHLFIAAWGMWVFTGRLGLPGLGRGVSALAFGLTSYLVARLGTYPTVTAAAWLPWILWAALGVLTEKRLRHVGWLALLTGLQLLAGHAQTAWYSLLLVGVFALFWVVRQRSRDGWLRLGMVTAGMLLGVGIAAAQLLPTMELLRTSQRSAGVDFDFAMNFSYGPARALNWVSPNVFGNPGDGTYLTEGAFFEDAVYIGLLPLISALAAIVGWIMRRFRKSLDPLPAGWTIPFWMGIGGVAFVLALGKYTPVFPFLFEHVPTFDLFQAPVRWHLWTVFALSVLAGIGTRSWGRGHWLFFGTRLAVAGGIGAALLAWFAALVLLSALDDAEAALALDVLRRAVVLTGLLGAGAGILTLLQPDPQHRRYPSWALGVLVFVAVDLGWAGQGLNPTVPAAFYDRSAAPESGEGRAYWPEEAERAVEFDTYLPFDDYRVAVENWPAFRQSQLPNLNLLDRWPLLNNFDPLRVGPFARYIR